MKKIGIVMGSYSDLEVAKKACAILDELGVGYEVHVYSAHRTPEEAGRFSQGAEKNGFGAYGGFHIEHSAKGGTTAQAARCGAWL